LFVRKRNERCSRAVAHARRIGAAGRSIEKTHDLKSGDASTTAFPLRPRGAAPPYERGRNLRARHSLLSFLPRHTAGLSHMKDSVVSTGARSAERRDLFSTIGRLSLRKGLSARPCGPRSRRRGVATCDSPARLTGEVPRYTGRRGEGLRMILKIMICNLQERRLGLSPSGPAGHLPRKTGGE